MSGTSLDGLDLAYCRISKTLDRWHYELGPTKSLPYDDSMKQQLKNAITLSADTLLELNNHYGAWLGTQVREFIDEQRLEVDFVASHGHTVHHQPEKGITYQIGSGQHLANTSGCTTICDFRSNDVALGGQGAPLVPIGDQLFFGNYDFCLNLGGISNVSFEKEGKRLAYDIGLANMLLNHITQKVGIPYDKGGVLAKKGQIIPRMLKDLNGLAYYQLPFPKSTGYEWFQKEVVPIVENEHGPMEDLLHTSVHHICEQIALQIKMHEDKTESTLFVTGGGALNNFLIETLRNKLGNTVTVKVPEKKLIEFKEALVFALMGVLSVARETNVLSSVTGAKKDSSSGVKYIPS